MLRNNYFSVKSNPRCGNLNRTKQVHASWESTYRAFIVLLRWIRIKLERAILLVPRHSEIESS
jgi:hypothetical protein